MPVRLSTLVALLVSGCNLIAVPSGRDPLAPRSPQCVFDCGNGWDDDTGDDEGDSDSDEQRDTAADGESAKRARRAAATQDTGGGALAPLGEMARALADSGHTFSAVWGGFVAEVPERALRGSFTAAGATLASADGVFTLQTTGVGRAVPGAASFGVDLVPSGGEPALGSCTPGTRDLTGRCVRRLELDQGAFVEWWSATGDGFEQGWTVDSPIEGDGPLGIRVAVDGATVLVGAEVDTGLVLLLSGGDEWIATPPAAVDATGSPLAAWFERDSEGFRVVVDDRGAQYPIEIDPVYTTASSTLTGPGTSYEFGYSVSGAGDVNGDGYDDVIVGAQRYSSYTGRAYVFHGSATGVSTTATTTLSPSTSGTYFGVAVSGAGDVNGDGYADVVVGASRYSSSTGRAYVYLGSASGVSTTVSTTLTGSASSNYFGNAVSSAGDVNDDGYADVVVGAYGYSSSTGRAYVFHGSASGLSSSVSTTLTGTSSSNYFGFSVSEAGDVNADGYADVIVGAYGYNTSTGRAYVFHGGASAVSTSAASTITGASTSYYLGYSVSGAGDANGDGYADVIIGAMRYSSYTGRAYVHHGSSTGVSTTATTTLTGSSTDDYFGRSVSGAGDVNGDGYADVVVGSPYYGADTGRAVVYEGSSAGVSSTAAASVVGASAEFLGYAVNQAGDVNGDGYADIIVGAPAYSSSTGRAYVHLGYAYIDADADGYYEQVDDCDDADATVSPAGTEIVDDGVDQDCDGVDDCYTDGDGDNYGTPTATAGSSLDCDSGSGAPNSTDCDDAERDTFPGAAPSDSTSACMNDDDGDDYGDDTVSGSAVAGTDCSDSSASVYPGRPETPGDGIDQDCDADDDCYEDDDDDGYGTATVITGTGLNCAAGPGASVATDCDDADAAINPGASETVADGVDQDCDDVDACYRDGDDDEHGTSSVVDGSSLDCVSGSGATTGGDCDDGNAAINPDATELPGDGVDQDCDDAELCYADDDDDGYVDESLATVSSSDTDCTDAGEGSSRDPSTDCDDSDRDVSPGDQEVCNGTDDDCDGLTDGDDDSVDIETAQKWYLDDDGDGYGVSGDSEIACDQPAGRAAERGDCDDADPAVHPDATELCNGIDDDCDDDTDEDDAEDATVWHPDDDEDGFGDAYREDRECYAPSGWIADGEDCVDSDDGVHPGADEYCNDRDDNCDGDVDEDSAVDATTWYIDADEDGYGNAENGKPSCSQPEGRVDDPDDCNDLNPYVHPGTIDDPYDGDDSDCDGSYEGTYVRGRSLASCATSGPRAPGLVAVLMAAAGFLRRRRRELVVAGMAAASGSAAAAERYDAHGFNLVPDDGDALDLLSTWRPKAQQPLSFGGTILGEYSGPTVDVYKVNGDDEDRDTLRPSFSAINLGGTFAITRAVGVSVAVPAFLGTDHTWGDVRLAVPLHALTPARGEPGFGLSFVPHLDVPTGDELNWLGNRGFGGGGTVATGWSTSRWQVVANVGGYYQPLIEYENLRAGPHLLAALGGGALVTDNIAVRAEVNYRPSLVRTEPAGAESPGEVLISARGSYLWGLNWTAGLGTAISSGVGASPIRVFVGGGGAIGKEPLADADRDHIFDALDNCKTEPETVNEYKDRDGCPDALGDLAVHLVDEDKNVVPDAAVAAAGATGTSDVTGSVNLKGVVPGRVSGTATHAAYEAARFDVDPLMEGPNEQTVTMRFKLVPVHVKTVDQNGAPVAARVRFEGPTDFGYRFVGANGLGTFELRPGKWRLLISTENGGTERRDIEVPPGRTEPVLVDVGFRPAMAVVDIQKREVVIKEAIYFDVGQATVQLASSPVINQVASVLLDHPEMLQMEVQGHTDSDGDAGRNLELSQRRVEAVCKMLIEQGVGAGRLLPRGYGETVPIASNSSEEGKAFNRRVQFVIIAMDSSAVSPTEVK